MPLGMTGMRMLRIILPMELTNIEIMAPILTLWITLTGTENFRMPLAMTYWRLTGTMRSMGSRKAGRAEARLW